MMYCGYALIAVFSPILTLSHTRFITDMSKRFGDGVHGALLNERKILHNFNPFQAAASGKAHATNRTTPPLLTKTMASCSDCIPAKHAPVVSVIRLSRGEQANMANCKCQNATKRGETGTMRVRCACMF